MSLRVLHIYSCWDNETEGIIKIAGATTLFDVNAVRLPDFKDGTPPNLFEFDVVTFGISDCYDGTCNIGRLAELRTYVENGGGIVWTHDSLEWKQNYGPDVEDAVHHDNPSRMEFRIQTHSNPPRPIRLQGSVKHMGSRLRSSLERVRRISTSSS
jgi:hypothetical protein